MVGPFVRPRIEEIDFVTGLWINAREIGTLERVASVARTCDAREFARNVEPNLREMAAQVRAGTFLQQMLSERRLSASEPLQAKSLAAARDQLRLQGFARDLEHRRRESIAITIEMIDGMNPYNFELLLGMMYEARGFHVIETPKSGAQGADVLLERGGERIVI